MLPFKQLKKHTDQVIINYLNTIPAYVFSAKYTLYQILCGTIWNIL